MHKLSLALLCMSSLVYGMETDGSNHLTVYSIPGQNGLGSEPEYVKQVLGYDESNNSIVQVPTPGMPDLGQSKCMGHLDQVLERERKDGIIYATSQGTATALNYIASKKARKKHVKGLVLEATLASGNSAIYHTATGPLMDLDFFTKIIPGAYYWLPYGAKGLFPFYRPGGVQAIKSLQHVPHDMPIIIIHSKQDMQLSYNDACALYYGLRKKGNDNVYFISNEGSGYIQIADNKKQGAIRAILTKHNLLKWKHDLIKNSIENVDLTPYQPDPAQYKQAYDMLMSQERNHECVETSLLVGLAAAVTAALYAGVSSVL